MRKIVLIIAIFVASLSAVFAQKSQLNTLFDKYEKKRSVESISISPSLLISMSEGKIDTSMERQINALSDIRILNVPSSAKEKGISISSTLKAEIYSFIEEYKFSRYAKIVDNNDIFELYVNKATKGALLFINSAEQELTIIALTGDISEEMISAIMKGGIKVSTK